MNKDQQSVSWLSQSHTKKRRRKHPNPGAPPLACNLWLEEEISRMGGNQRYAHLYKPWLEHYRALRGFYPADPRRSFRAAVSGSLKRLRERRPS
jgi:hypothetical protein